MVMSRHVDQFRILDPLCNTKRKSNDLQEVTTFYKLFSDYIYPSGKEGRRKEWNKGRKKQKECC